MFCGFYAIYREMITKKCNYSKLFIICAFVFASVGTLYHCVFAMTAYIYNKLYNLQVLEDINSIILFCYWIVHYDCNG